MKFSFNWKRFLKQQILFSIIYYGLFFHTDAHAASLIFSVAGAAIGTLFGAPQLGYILGGMVGNALFGETQKNVGPRLTDLKVQSNTNGTPIPDIWGTQAVYGQLIWSSGFIIEEHHEKQGKGMGPSVENDYQTAKISFALALGYGPLQMRRAWFNEKLSIDYSGTSTVTGDLAKYVTFYSGSEDQQPDPTIQQYVGAPRCPAFAGISYILVKDLPLADFGNQIPQVKVEVTKTLSNIASSSYTYHEVPYTASVNTELFINPINNDIVSINSISGGCAVSIIDPITYAVKNTATLPFSTVTFRNTANDISKLAVTKNGKIVFHSRSDSNKSRFVSINLEDLTYDMVDSGDYSGTSDPFLSLKTLNVNNVLEMMMIPDDLGKINYFAFNSSIIADQVIVGSISFPNNLSCSAQAYQLLSTKTEGLNFHCGDGKGSFYFPSYGKSGANIDRTKVYVNKISNGILSEAAVNIENNPFINFYIESIKYDKLNDKIFVTTYLDGAGAVNLTYSTKLYRIDAKTMSVDSIVPLDIPNYFVSPMMNFDLTNRKLIGFALDKVSGSASGYFITIGMDDLNINKSQFITSNISNFKMRYTPNGSVYNKSEDSYLYASNNGSGTQYALVVNKGMRLALGTYPLSNLISELCLKSGMTLDQIDTSDLNGIDVRGFLRASQTSARSLIETLALLYNFDGLESNKKIRFNKRGKAPIATIYEDDLGARFFQSNQGNYDQAIFRTQRTSEIELPRTVNILYYDLQKDYAQNTQEARRFVNTTSNTMTVEAPAVFTADEAMQIAKRVLYQTWVSREKFQWETNLDFVELEPGDVVVIDRGTVKHTIRIVKKDESQGIIKFEGEAEEVSLYIQDGAKGSQGQVSTQTVAVTSETDLYLLDLPIFDISDNNIGVYAVVDKKTPEANWNGAKVYKSDSQTGNFSAQETFTSYATIGTANSVLAEGHYTNYEDYISSVIVTINNGQLESIDEDEMGTTYNNFALIGNELIQYQNADLIGPKQYRLSTLLRGRFGRENFQASHQLNEICIFFNFDNGSLKRLNKDDYMIGVEKFYKAVSIGKIIADTTAISFTNNAVGLMPYSVVNVDSGRNTAGDLLLTWDKRIRGKVIFGSGTLDPVDPDGDSYEIDIINNGSVIRTIKTNSLNLTYSASDQITDFGSIQSQISLKIYKMSSVIGRGFEFSKTF
jgi:hypothetical protein